MAFIFWVVALLCWIAPSAVLAKEGDGASGEESVAYFEVLDLDPLFDRCYAPVSSAYTTWHAYHLDKLGLRDRGVTRQEAKEWYDVADIGASLNPEPHDILQDYAVDLVYDGKSLRETEKAVYKRCRSY